MSAPKSWLAVGICAVGAVLVATSLGVVHVAYAPNGIGTAVGTFEATLWKVCITVSFGAIPIGKRPCSEESEPSDTPTHPSTCPTSVARMLTLTWGVLSCSGTWVWGAVRPLFSN